MAGTEELRAAVELLVAKVHAREDRVEITQQGKQAEWMRCAEWLKP
ncbi:hypothetical protein ACFZDJ_35465 [Streptomyces sp. NPDC007896]